MDMSDAPPPGQGDLGRLQRVTAHPLISYSIGVAEIVIDVPQVLDGFWKGFRLNRYIVLMFWTDFGRLEAGFFDYLRFLDGFWRA